MDALVAMRCSQLERVAVPSKPGQRSPCPDEGLLCEIQRVFFIPDDLKGVHVDSLPVAGDQIVESHRVAVPGTNQQSGFLGIVTHSSMTHETGRIFDDQELP